MFTVFSDLQLLNAYDPMDDTLSPRLADTSESQPLKADSPISSMFLPKDTFFKDLQLSKASLLIFVTWSPMTTSFRELL